MSHFHFTDANGKRCVEVLSPEAASTDARMVQCYEALEAEFAAGRALDTDALATHRSVMERGIAELVDEGHKGRVAHWQAELARIGLAPRAKPAAPAVDPKPANKTTISRK